MGIDLTEVIGRLDPDGAIRASRKRAGEAQPASPALSPRHDLLSKRVRAYLATKPGAVSGRGGHNTTFEAAQALVNGFELRPAEALGFLLSDYNPKCEPPWSLRELEHKVEEAVKKPCDKPRGWLLADDRSSGSATVAARAEQPPAAVAGQSEPAADADLNEADDDPDRLARSILAGYQHHGRRTLVYWKGEFCEWAGTGYVAPEQDGFQKRVHRAVHREAKAIYRQRRKDYDPESGDGPPRMIKVTQALVNNVLAALASYCLHESRQQPPFWIDHEGPDPADLVSTATGIVHLPAYAAGQPDAIMDHTPALFTFNPVGFAADHSAPEPAEWLAFLAGLWPGDPESIALLQEWFGYLLTPDTEQHKMLLIVGPPRSGKSTIQKVLRLLVGEGSYCTPTLGDLAEQFGLDCLLNQRVAAITDANLSRKADADAITEKLKAISGEDGVNVQRKYLPTLRGVRMSVRFILTANQIPKLPDSSGAFADRCCMLKLTRSHTGREDRGLYKRLSREQSGIFNWAVAGWSRLQKQGRFTSPAASAEIMDELRAVSSPIAEFVAERCQVGSASPAGGLAVEVEELYAEWKKWCEESGRKEPGTKVSFGIGLRSCVPHMVRVRARTPEGFTRVYRGLRLRPYASLDSDEPALCPGVPGNFPLYAQSEKNGLSDQSRATIQNHRAHRAQDEGEI